jgi:hypothetical protein
VSDTSWPIPFGGITYGVEFTNRKEFQVVAIALLNEKEHRHNFALQCDGMIIWVANAGLECLRRHIAIAGHNVIGKVIVQ